MNEGLVKRIKEQLNAKFYIMNDTWLRDCIEYFISSDTSNAISDKQILEFVKGQWQLSDLREISNENGCLPKDLIQNVHTVLPYNYILQVDKMYDINSSKYKQLCKIRKVNNENLEVTEDEKQSKSENRRMFQLYLTDGVQDITAIEYIPLQQLTGTLLPGYKIMIIGPVDCRRGIILLEPGKYQEVGGEVELLLKSNALENVLARALDEPENSDPYNDNNRNIQNILPNSSSLEETSETSFFDDDFEQAIDLDAVTAIEQQSRTKTVQNRLVDVNERKQITQGTREEIKETTEENLENFDFESMEDWSNNLPMEPLQVPPTSNMERFRENDVIIVEDASNSTYQSRNRLHPATSSEDKNTIKFPDDDFDFNDCNMIVETEESQKKDLRANRMAQDRNFAKFESNIETWSRMTNKPKLINDNISMEVQESMFNSSTEENKKSTPVFSPMASTSRTVQQIPKTKPISNSSISESSKICHVLSDVLRETITDTIYRTVRGQIKKHSALTKQGKCWTVTTQILDHTSSLEVCFDSEILERFLGFTVQEFSVKRKLAKSDPQIDNELRLRLRNAQQQIHDLNALFKLKLSNGQMPKIVEITQLTENKNAR